MRDLIGQLNFPAQKSTWIFVWDRRGYVASGRHILTWNFYLDRYNTLNFVRKNLNLKYFQEISIMKLNFEFEIIVNIYTYTELILKSISLYNEDGHRDRRQLPRISYENDHSQSEIAPAHSPVINHLVSTSVIWDDSSISILYNE